MNARTFFRACGFAAVTLAAATAAHAADVTLAWDPTNEPGIAGYRVEFGPYPGYYTNNLDVGNRTTARITGLVTGTPYYFVVRAYNTSRTLGEPSVEISTRAGIRMAGRGDFTGDYRSEFSVYRPSTGTWYFHNASQRWGVQFGVPGDVPVAGDYDGDGRIDPAVFRPSTGRWFFLFTSGGWTNVAFGGATDKLVPGDYNGDGKTDIAVFRPSNGTWYVRSVDGTFNTSFQWGNGADDKPVPGDYDGDGVTDYAAYRPSVGKWYIMRSRSGYFEYQWGSQTDTPIPADYDGDGKTDIAQYRAVDGIWYIRNSSNNTTTAQQWGWSTDLPVPTDFDGDGKTDISVFRPSNGTWYVKGSTGVWYQQQWGATNDVPVTKVD